MLYKTSKIVYWRLIFTIYDMGIQAVTRAYRGLQEVAGGYKGLQGVKKGYRGLQGVTRGYRGLQGVTKGYRGLQGVRWGDKGLHGVTNDYRNFPLPRTFPDTFPWSILHKNLSSRNLKFLTKTMD